MGFNSKSEGLSSAVRHAAAVPLLRYVSLEFGAENLAAGADRT